MIDRAAVPLLDRHLGSFPVVFLHGARQVGKSTLAKARGTTYATLDERAALEAAGADPESFVERGPGLLVIDEVQRAPDLPLAIKRTVDADRRPGRFLLTGSASILVLPRLADALVGRMGVLTLWPFSQAEIERRPPPPVDAWFAGEEPRRAPTGDVMARICRGGFPEVVLGTADRRLWFESYVTTVLQRDLRDVAAVDDLAAIPRLLALFAAATAQTRKLADLSRDAGIPVTTVRRYTTLLEGLFLIRHLPAWSTNTTRRLVKSPKVHVVDSGLAAHLVGADEARLGADGRAFGALLESFAVNEVVRAAEVSEVRPSVFHFRAHDGAEVDLVLEARDGRLVGIEIKAAVGVGERDLRGLRALRELAGDRFVQGLVLTTGDTVTDLGGQIRVAPIGTLWG